jgi:hypothetical protein
LLKEDAWEIQIFLDIKNQIIDTKISIQNTKNLQNWINKW